MAVIKLTVTSTEALQQACDLADVKIKKTSEVNKTKIFELAFKHPKQLFDAGQLYAEFQRQEVKPEPKQEPKKPADNEPKKPANKK